MVLTVRTLSEINCGVYDSFDKKKVYSKTQYKVH